MGLLDASHERAGGKRPALLLLFLALTIVVINVSNWLVLSRATESVEDELGLRLVTVAGAAVSTTTAELLLAPDVGDDAFVLRTLQEIADRHDLEDVFLVDPDGILLWDLRGGELGDPSPFFDLDFEAFTKAASGIPAASPTVEVDGVGLKAAFAPVEDWDGTVEAVLGVTAGGGFHERVPALRRALVGVTIGGAALVVILGAVFFGMSRRLTLTESALSRAETLSAMGMMAAGVAHEVRNPLAIISGTAARLKKRYSPDGTADPLFDFIPEEVERLNGIVEGYLRFARDEPLLLVECDLREVVDRGARLVREELASQRVALSQSGTTDPVHARADPQRLQQALLNLLLNAAQAMPDGGEVEVTLETEGRRAIVGVADHGPGFGQRELRSAFTPFFTTKEQGSGLGLVMARRIVEGHGGAIRIANRPGRGAVVTIELPLHEGGEVN
jgi:signal transduction histidine kinase